MKTKSIAKGALILTLANILTRILGFIYRIYMSNVLGAEGMGLYQLIVPIYMLVWSISSSGFSTTISKLVAQENAKNSHGNMNRVLRNSMLMSGLTALVLSAVVYITADEISIKLLKDSRAILSLRLLCTCFPFMALGSCIRGYFFGLQESKVPAASQVLEQVTRMAIIFFLAGTLIPRGVEYAAAAAVTGMCIGEIASFIYVLISLKHFRRKNELYSKSVLPNSKICLMILAIAVPLTANRVTSSLLSTIENIMIPQKLQAFGMTNSEAMSIYGELTGMAMPLIMFPSSLLTALSIALVPAISEAAASKKQNRISSALSKSMSLTAIIGIGTSGLFLTFPYELGMTIYNQEGIGELLFLMGLACPFLYLQVTLSGILNGLGEQVFIFRNNLIGSAISIASIYFIVPLYGINAFILGWFVSMITVSLFDMERIISRTGLKINFMQWIIKPAICITSCCLVTKLIYVRFLTNLGNILSIITAVTILCSLYIFFLISIGCLKIKMIKELIKSAVK